MPTAAEFQNWANELDAMGDDLATISRVTPDHAPRTIMVGTENEAPVITAVEQITGNASTAAVHLDTLASLCRDRARACEWYTDAYRSWQASMERYVEAATDASGLMASPPGRPQRPGPWAEVG